MAILTETLPLTAADLMTREVRTLRADLPLRDAARELDRLGLRGAPVVDADGRCVGVLSVSDLARWSGRPKEPTPPLPRTCSFQHVDRAPGGRETVRCLLDEGVCPFQHPGDGAVVCTQPHCVPTDWQVVETVSAPDVVRDLMTTQVVAVGLDAPVAEIARVMLDCEVHRTLVLDAAGRPVGLVSVADLLQVLAHPEAALQS